MNPNQVPALLDKAVSLLNGRDVEGFLSLFVEKPTWVSDSLMARRGDSNEPGLPAGPEGVSGRDVIRDGLLAFTRAFPNLEIGLIPQTTVTDGRTAAVLFAAKGTNARTEGDNGWLTNIGRTGREISITGSVFLTFDGNLVQRMTTHWNCAKAMAQLGMRSYARPGPR